MLVIISDVHDNLANLDKVIAWAKSHRAEAILECGDLTNADTLQHLASNWPKTLYVLQGNCDLYQVNDLKSYNNIIDLGRQGGVFEIDGIRIGACHEPHWLAGLLPQKPQIVFYGHTHIPWEEVKQGVRFVNPGNVSNTRHSPSFASFEPSTNELNLILLDELV